MDKKCTVVVSSCDKYEDIWMPCFKLLKIQWPNMPYPIVLNTESKSFSYEDMDITTFNFYKPNEEVSWGERLKRTLENIESEYILFTLDDYFISEPVREDIITKCMGWMDENKNIACFYLIYARGANTEEAIKYPGFVKRPQVERYKLSAQTSLWRKDLFLKYVSDEDKTPWDWEILGSRRCFSFTEEFYSVMAGEKYALQYDSGGCGLRRGKWLNRISIFDKYNIEIDFSKRGFLDR